MLLTLILILDVTNEQKKGPKGHGTHDGEHAALQP